MKVCVIAWNDVINPRTNEYYDKEDLLPLDSITKGPILEIDELNTSIKIKLIEEFIREGTDISYNHYDVEII